MGGLFGIGGSSSKTDRSTTLKGYGALENVFNYAVPQAEQQVAAGTGAVEQAEGYNAKLLSGDRATAAQAIAPEANAAQAGSDAQKRQLATSGTARGGGTAAVNQKRSTDTLADIDNMLFGARAGAAKSQGALGLGQVGAGGNLLSTGAGSASDLTNAAIGSKKNSDANQAALGQGIGDLAAALLFA